MVTTEFAVCSDSLVAIVDRTLPHVSRKTDILRLVTVSIYCLHSPFFPYFNGKKNA
jgi:hypothetical protein